MASNDPLRTRVTFLGTGSVVPDPGDDTASLLLNGTCLVDTGWYAPLNMRRFGFSPLDLEYVFLTHCHQDHYLGLAGVLFYLAMRRQERPARPALKVAGPAGDIRRVVDLARAYLQTERFPDVEPPVEVIPLHPGDSLGAGALQVATVGSIHPVQGLVYRFTDTRTGASLVVTGDTAYHPPIADLARGCDLLVHEASHGPRPADPASRWGHSGAPDAARIALEADAGRLALIHCTQAQQPEALAAVRGIFPNAFFPGVGESIELP